MLRAASSARQDLGHPVQDLSTRRNAFVMLAEHAQDKAVAYLFSQVGGQRRCLGWLLAPDCVPQQMLGLGGCALLFWAWAWPDPDSNSDWAAPLRLPHVQVDRVADWGDILQIAVLDLIRKVGGWSRI